MITIILLVFVLLVACLVVARLLLHKSSKTNKPDKLEWPELTKEELNDIDTPTICFKRTDTKAQK